MRRGYYWVSWCEIVGVSQEVGREECERGEGHEEDGKAKEVFVGEVWVEGDFVCIGV